MSADPKLPHEYRNSLSTDWDYYKTELVSEFGDWGGDILTEDDIENSVNVLQSKIIAAYEKTCPLKTELEHTIFGLWSGEALQGG
jgi:predicted hydrolase (HD superfamily)